MTDFEKNLQQILNKHGEQTPFIDLTELRKDILECFKLGQLSVIDMLPDHKQITQRSYSDEEGLSNDNLSQGFSYGCYWIKDYITKAIEEQK